MQVRGSGDLQPIRGAAKMQSMNPDEFTHAFKTFLGIPPAKGEPPICGATLTDAYDFPGVERPICPKCKALIDA
jgi:hypothetical protein